jgi:hypothetical protein
VKNVNITFTKLLILLILIFFFALACYGASPIEPNQIPFSLRTLHPFWQNIISTFIGAFLAFIFSICLFYLTTHLQKKSQRASLEKNLIREFEFNEQYLAKLLSELNKAIEKITVNDHNVYFLGKYEGFQRLFIQFYFQQGFLYEKLTSEDINLLDTILNHMAIATGQYIYNQISSWKSGQLNQSQILGIVAFERDTIESYIGNLGKLKQKLKNAAL